VVLTDFETITTVATLGLRHVLVLFAYQRWALAIVNEDDFVARMKYTRSSLRVNSRVRIDVEWTEAGETHHVQGYTIDISSKGCLAVVAQGFAVGQKLRLKNLVNGRTMDATLVWRGHEGRAGWELGLELDGIAEDFWEVEF